MATINNLIYLQLPKFDGEKKFEYWRTQMQLLFEYEDLWDIVEQGFVEPVDQATLTQEQRKQLDSNRKKDLKARMYINQWIEQSVFEKIAHVTTAKKAWDILTNICKEVENVRRVQLQTLRSQFEFIQMEKSENISDYFSRILTLVNQLKAIGEDITDLQVVEKILCTLTEKYEDEVSIIRESKDLNIITLDELKRSLQVYEQHLHDKGKLEIIEAQENQLSLEKEAHESQNNSNSNLKIQGLENKGEMVIRNGNSDLYAINVGQLEQNVNHRDISTGSGPSSPKQMKKNEIDNSTGLDSSSHSVENNINSFRPSLNLLSGKNKENHKLCLDLHKASLGGNVRVAKSLLKSNPRSKLLSEAITEEYETVLHVAAGAKQTGFVKEMINLIDKEDFTTLKLIDKRGNTAFCFAAMVGSTPIAKIMLERDLSLLTIRGHQNMTPLYICVLFGQREMASFLYYEMKNKAKEVLEKEKKVILLASIDNNLYDLALELLEDDKKNELAPAYYSGYKEPWRKVTPLHVLAEKPLHLLDKACGNDKMTLSTQALRLIEHLWEKVLEKEGPNVGKYFSKNKDLLFTAAHLGNFKFLAKLIRLYPDLVHQRDENGRSIFHIAVIHRDTNLLSLINEIGIHKQLIASYYIDIDGNILLHLAGKYLDQRPVSMVPGAALEMQQELIFFKEVERMTMASRRALENMDRKTAGELFTTEHKELLKNAEDWMRNTASQCMLVATIIATVVFSAAFSLPGSDNDREGISIHQKNIAFHIFAVTDTIALSSSSISILMFLSILTSRYVETDFLKSLPLKLVAGVLTLSISIATMMIAFSSSFFLAYNQDRLNQIPVLIGVLVVVPVILFIFLQYSLLRDILYSSFRFKFSSQEIARNL